MPNQNQTGPNGQGAATGKGQGRCQNFNQGSTDQDTSLSGVLQRRFRAGQQEQEKGRGNGRRKGARFHGGCRR